MECRKSLLDCSSSVDNVGSAGSFYQVILVVQEVVTVWEVLMVVHELYEVFVK